MNHEIRVYAGWDTGTNAPTGPTQLYREDWAQGYVESLTMSASPNVTDGKPTGTETISSLETLSRLYTNLAGQVINIDGYFLLAGLAYSTSTSLGTKNTNYYRTEQGYDSRGRPNRTLTPTGTIYRTVYDGPGRAASDWVGLDDTPTSGSWSPTNTEETDLVKTTEYQYDSGGVGDGNLTKVTEIPGGSATNRVTQGFFDWRNRLVAAKAGVEGSESASVNRPIVYYTYDNLDEVTAAETFDGDTVSITTTNGVPDAPSSSLRRSKSTASYDELGRVYKSETFSVDTSGNISSNALTTNLWFDYRGNVIKVSAPGGTVSKTVYDGARRVSKGYVTDGGGDTGYSDADDVTSDNVLEQMEYDYDDSGNVLMTTYRRRFHDEADTGELGTPTTGVNARVSYVAAWYDKADRPTDVADVGTNAGSSYTRPSSAPSRSDTALVTSWAYNAAGWVETTTDPRGIASKTYYDNLGQVTKTIEAYVDGTPSDSDDKTTEFTYNGSGLMTTLKASLTSGYQETKWVYGTSTSTGDDINSSDLLKEIHWPNKSSGIASSTDKEVITVNALDETKTYTDRNVSVHTYTRDVLGRLTTDAVTTLASGVDSAVRRLETAFDTYGNPYLFTSYDAASGGNIVNQVQRDFNGLGQMTKEYQEHSGAVNTSTSANVQYSWSEMSGGANHSRLNTMTYPNGKVLTYNYASGLDSNISRLTSLSDTSGTLEEFTFLGVDTVVRRAHSQPGVDLTYIKQSGESNGDAGDQYTGIDRFDRIVDQRWIKTSDGTHRDRFKYGYDRNSNRLYRTNELDHNFDELYHANGASNGYDSLNQLTEFRRGTLSDTNSDNIPDTVSSASRTQSWTIDAQGNFSTVTTDSNGVNRTHNKQNQLTAVGSNNLAFDANGNETTDENGKTLVYDAWNRLVAYKNGSTVLVSNEYDALGRRIFEGPGTGVDFYYSADWQILEERVDGDPTIQYVWSPVYVDAMILRDRDTDANGSLDERLWVMHDANYNVTGLLNGSAVVQERYVYDPYGTFTIHDASWGSRSSSDFAWVHLHQGLRYNATIGAYDNFGRWFDPDTGRFLNVDPEGFDAGDTNFYRYVSNGPGNGLDPTGLDDSKRRGGSFGADSGRLWRNLGRVAREIRKKGLIDGLMGDTPDDWEHNPKFKGDEVTLPGAKTLPGIGNPAAGVADALTGGGTQQVREAMGTDDMVHKDSSGYRIGWWVGFVMREVIEIGVMKRMGGSGGGPPGRCMTPGGLPRFLQPAARRAFPKINKYLNRVCFAAGTHLRTKDGSKPIEQFREGDRLLTAPENDVEAPVVEGVVEAVVTKVGPLLELGVQGRTIKVTAEHPFWVRSRGWLEAKELLPGDLLRSHDGRWVALQSVKDSGEVATVYNLSVAEYHTYFVGEAAWGWSVWSHNTKNPCVAALERAKNIRNGKPASILGPSGKPKIHSPKHPTLKRAKDAARRRVGRGGSVEKDSTPKKGGPHFHGSDRDGVRSRIHDEFPWSFK